MIRGNTVVIEAALNGGRDRAEHPAIPYAPEEIAAEARRCADVGATVFHVHARGPNGEWSADPALYVAVVRSVREAVPDGLVSITSIRPAGVDVRSVLDLLADLAGDGVTKPDLVSVNVGHIVAWEPSADAGPRRHTSHWPNAYDDVTGLLAACAEHGIRPELGIMDLGFVSNAVALRDDGALPADPWFLIELDSPAFGSGFQVAPATVANYAAISAAMREHFPGARWAAHGQGIAGYDVLRRALADGSHVRVGFEDAVHLPDGTLARSNADLVAWAADAARAVGRTPAAFAEAGLVVGMAI